MASVTPVAGQQMDVYTYMATCAFVPFSQATTTVCHCLIHSTLPILVLIFSGESLMVLLLQDLLMMLNRKFFTGYVTAFFWFHLVGYR